MNSSGLMNGSTVVCEPYWEDIFRFVLYIIVGTLSTVVNLLIIVAIVRYKPLHKKNFILLVGLSLGHTFDGGSYLAAGWTRLRMVLTCTEKLLVTRFDCMQAPSNSMVIIGESMSAWMILILSLDRMLAASAANVTAVSSERKKRTYAMCAVAFAFVAALIDCLGAWVISWWVTTSRTEEDGSDGVPALCMFAYAVPNWYYFMHKMHMIVCGFVSVSVYIWVVCSLAHRRRTKVTSDSVRALQLKREWRVTKTLAFIIFLTFGFQIVPVTLYVSELKNSAFLVYSGSYVWTAYCANDAWDMLFYAWKMTDLRHALRGVVCWWRPTAAAALGHGATAAYVGASVKSRA